MLEGKWEIVVKNGCVKSITLNERPINNVQAIRINVGLASSHVEMWLKILPDDLVYIDNFDWRDENVP